MYKNIDIWRKCFGNRTARRRAAIYRRVVIRSHLKCAAPPTHVSRGSVPRCLQGPPGEKGASGASDIIDFNGKLLDAFQVSVV